MLAFEIVPQGVGASGGAEGRGFKEINIYTLPANRTLVDSQVRTTGIVSEGVGAGEQDS